VTKKHFEMLKMRKCSSKATKKPFIFWHVVCLFLQAFCNVTKNVIILTILGKKCLFWQWLATCKNGLKWKKQKKYIKLFACFSAT